MAKRAENVTIFRYGNERGEEYIVITDNEDESADDHLLPGFEHAETHDAEIEAAHMLPLGYPLMVRR